MRVVGVTSATAAVKAQAAEAAKQREVNEKERQYVKDYPYGDGDAQS